MQISPTIVAVIVVAALIVIAVVVLLRERKRKTDLKRRFGTEYERAVRERGSEREARATLEAREKRVEKFNIRELSRTERDRYAEQWRTVQSRFVDDPKGAVIEADETVASLMTVRGGIPSRTLNNVRQTFPLITLTSCKTTVPLMKLPCGIAKAEQVRKTCGRP